MTDRYTPAQRRVLEAIDTDAASHGRASIARLAALCGTSRMGVIRTARALEARGVLIRYMIAGRVHFGRPGNTQPERTQ